MKSNRTRTAIHGRQRHGCPVDRVEIERRIRSARASARDGRRVSDHRKRRPSDGDRSDHPTQPPLPNHDAIVTHRTAPPRPSVSEVARSDSVRGMIVG